MTPAELVATLRGPLRNFSYRLPAADMIEQLQNDITQLDAELSDAVGDRMQAEHDAATAQARVAELEKVIKRHLPRHLASQVLR